jgi:RHS repeat-associated protein
LARSDHKVSSVLKHALYHADGNGSVTCLLGTNQLVLARYHYDPYGNMLAASGALAEANLYRFSSKEWHASAGLYYYGYRFYEPNLQRWLSRDPIEEAGGINLYGFVGNNPINNIDPFGLLTAVFVGGPSPADDQNSSGNPFGHAAIAFTGQGVFSFGTPEGLGSAFTDFLNNQAKYRDGTVYILNTTPEQEKAMADYLKKVKQDRPKLGRYPDNCAHRTTGALSAGGIDLTQISLASPIGMPIAVPIDNFPSDIALALRSMHALQISVPKGGTLPPKFLTGFNPK